MSQKKWANALLLFALVFLCPSCGSDIVQAPAIAEDSWTLAEVLTRDETRDAIVEYTDVRNCGYSEQKQTECSAGTLNDLTLTQEVGSGIDVGIEVISLHGSISTSVGRSLGIGRQSGEVMGLETPPEGHVYRYALEKEYRTLTGDALARSSKGKEGRLSYTFHASCSIRVESRELLTCEDAKSGVAKPSLTPVSVPLAETQVPAPTIITPTDIQMPTATSVPPTDTPWPSPTNPPPTPTSPPQTSRFSLETQGFFTSSWHLFECHNLPPNTELYIDYSILGGNPSNISLEFTRNGYDAYPDRVEASGPQYWSLVFNTLEGGGSFLVWFRNNDYYEEAEIEVRFSVGYWQ